MLYPISCARDVYRLPTVPSTSACQCLRCASVIRYDSLHVLVKRSLNRDYEELEKCLFVNWKIYSKTRGAEIKGCSLKKKEEIKKRLFCHCQFVTIYLWTEVVLLSGWLILCITFLFDFFFLYFFNGGSRITCDIRYICAWDHLHGSGALLHTFATYFVMAWSHWCHHATVCCGTPPPPPHTCFCIPHTAPLFIPHDRW